VSGRDCRIGAPIITGTRRMGPAGRSRPGPAGVGRAVLRTRLQGSGPAQVGIEEPRPRSNIRGMGRSLRPHLPGVVFHVTSRLQGHQPLYAGLENIVISYVRELLVRRDVHLIAYAVMPNHIHLLVQQGALPLGHFMQPLLRRVALLLQRTRGCVGHVVERRYREQACLTADYLRAAVAYVHLNGLRAGLANCVEDYEWSSHSDFLRSAPLNACCQPVMEDALRLYARNEGDSMAQCAANYRDFVKWRLLMDQWRNAKIHQSFYPPATPRFHCGDDHWSLAFAPFVQAIAENRRDRPYRMDLRDLAMAILRDVAADMTVDDLRAGGSSRVEVAARRMIIRRAAAVGHTGKAIAHYLGVSPATVSSVLNAT
jgi:putative transposase